MATSADHYASADRLLASPARHRQVKVDIDAMGAFSPRQSLVVRAIGAHEGGYGAGWRREPAEWAAQQVGIDPTSNAEAAITSKNWGAVQGTGPAGFFWYRDSHADGSKYAWKYRRYNNHAEAARSVLNTASRTDAEKLAIAAGDWPDVAAAMKAARYYEASQAAYTRALIGAAAEICAATGETPLNQLPHETSQTVAGTQNADPGTAPSPGSSSGSTSSAAVQFTPEPPPSFQGNLHYVVQVKDQQWRPVGYTVTQLSYPVSNELIFAYLLAVVTQPTWFAITSFVQGSWTTWTTRKLPL